jgi:hypothetical protein
LYATTLRATANFNIRQAARLNRLSMYRHETGASRFMFELIVSPERLNCDRLGGDKAAYDLDARPTLMAQTIEELQNAGVEPDVRKVEGFDRREDCESIVRFGPRRGARPCRVHYPRPGRRRSESAAIDFGNAESSSGSRRLRGSQASSGLL